MKYTLKQVGDHYECPYCRHRWPTPVTNRVIKERPLYPAAVDAANRELAENCRHAQATPAKPRRLTMEAHDYPCRRRWMDAYLAYRPPKENKKPAKPCEECPKKGVLVVKVVEVSDSARIPVPDATVQLDPSMRHAKTDAKGVVKFTELDPRRYVAHAWKKDYGEEIGDGEVPPGSEVHVEIKIVRQIAGILPVLVVDEKNRVLQGAAVTATPVYKTPGSYKAMTVRTDSLGMVHFTDMRWNTYTVSAVKDGAPSSTETGTVSRPGMNPTVRLRIDRSMKPMSIEVTFSRWYKLSLPPKPSATPSPTLIGIDAYFRITDKDTGRSATYLVSCTKLGVSLGTPFSAAKTVKAGPPREFTVLRALKLDEGSFGGHANISIYSIGTNGYFDLQLGPVLPVNVSQIQIGPSTDPFPSLENYAGAVTMMKQ